MNVKLYIDDKLVYQNTVQPPLPPIEPPPPPPPSSKINYRTMTMEVPIENEFLNDKSIKFYKVTAGVVCKTEIQIWLAGRVPYQYNCDMLISDTDFITPEKAINTYNYFFDKYGYGGSMKMETYQGANYWVWFAGSAESEMDRIKNPIIGQTYYIMVINKTTNRAAYRLAAYCY